MRKISVITPCFNEAENVEICAAEELWPSTILELRLL
jgi:hypothetical protein